MLWVQFILPQISRGDYKRDNWMIVWGCIRRCLEITVISCSIRAITAWKVFSIYWRRCWFQDLHIFISICSSLVCLWSKSLLTRFWICFQGFSTMTWTLDSGISCFSTPVEVKGNLRHLFYWYAFVIRYWKMQKC